MGLFDAVRKPEEFVGLPSGFLTMGAAGVISSQWRVDDASTALLMGKFYDLHLRENKRPSQALHLAQLWLKSSDKAALSAFVDGQASRGALTPAQAATTKAAITAAAGDRPYEPPYYWAAFSYFGA